jgi:YD repeat-containing protein
VYLGTNTYQRVAWTATERDDRGKPTTVHGSDGSLVETTWGCCGKESETTADGSVTTYEYDGNKRLLFTTRVGITGGSYPNQADITTTNTYDAAGEKLVETVLAGGVSRTSTWAYDATGRVTNEVDAAGLVTTHAYDTANRVETVTLPGGATRITTRYKDGRTASITGTAAPAQYYSYGANADGTRWTRVATVSSNGPSWTTSTSDFLGRTVAEVRPAYGGGTLVTSNLYSSAGHLRKSASICGQTLLSQSLFAYDELGNQTASALDLDLDGDID